MLKVIFNMSSRFDSLFNDRRFIIYHIYKTNRISKKKIDLSRHFKINLCVAYNLSSEHKKGRK